MEKEHVRYDSNQRQTHKDYTKTVGVYHIPVENPHDSASESQYNLEALTRILIVLVSIYGFEPYLRAGLHSVFMGVGSTSYSCLGNLTHIISILQIRLK